MKTRICFLIGNYNNSGGTERVTSQIANGLSNRNFDVTIVSIEQGLAPHFYTDSRVKLYELNCIDEYVTLKKSRIINNMYFRLWCMNRTRKIKKSFEKVLKIINPNVVIAVDIQCYRIIDAYRKQYHYKTIGWEHFSLLTRNSIGINYSRYLATKHAAKLLVLSDNDLLDYQAKYPKARNLMRMHNPIAFTPTQKSDMGNKVVIAAGRYVPQKGFDLLIKSWSKIAECIPDWELRIYGDGEDKEKLSCLILENKLINVKLLPYAKNLDIEMEKASIYALSSRFEGWGLVLIEAQAKGLACISFECKHGPSEIIDNGVNGFLVPPEDVDVFADKLLELIKNNNLRQEFSNNSQKDLHRFEIDTIIAQWTDMLKSI